MHLMLLHPRIKVKPRFVGNGGFAFSFANKHGWRVGRPVCAGRGQIWRNSPSQFPFLARSHALTFKHITCDPKRLNGRTCIRQLRWTVRRAPEAVATYPDLRDGQREFPELETADIREVLAYAAANLDDKVIELTAAG
jgi:uncharacterized protein (DUF433 family)